MGRVFFNTRKNVVDQDGAHTMTAEDSGKVFMLSSTAGACEITLLPAASLIKGWHCKFIVKEDTPTGVITIAAGSAIIDMVQKDSAGDAANSTAGSAASNIVVATTATQGDYVNLICDGSTYYAECLSGAGDKITTS
jgi:hypothetical protein